MPYQVSYYLLEIGVSMKKKTKLISIFVILPVLLVVVFVLSLKFDGGGKQEPTTEKQSVYSDEEISNMLLAEYNKSQAALAQAEQSTEEVKDLTPEDEEYDDMIGDAKEDAPDIVTSDEELSAEDEAIIAAAEQEARTSSSAFNYNGIEVVSSMNQVDLSGGLVLSLTDAEIAAAHPLFLQYDPRWATFPYGTGTMKSSACGPTCFAMVITALTNISNASPPMIASYSMNHNYYVPGAGTAHGLFLNGCSDFGLYCNEISNDEATMKAAIDRGEMLVLSVHYGNFTHSGAGHFIVIYGYNENGFMVNDPASYDRSCRYWPYGVFSGDINKIYSLGRL